MAITAKKQKARRERFAVQGGGFMSQKSSVDQFTDHRQLVGSDGHIKGHLLEAQVGQVKVIA